MFFVGNAIRRSRGDFGKHAMLIHPSQKTYDHRMVARKISGIREDWRNKAKIKASGHNDISFLSLRKRLLNAYNNFISDGVIAPSYSELEPTILDCIKKCSPVLICNSDEHAGENQNLYSTNILVGGNLVERGITIKGLAVTYITRRAKGKSNVDNTEQRARWFGYKEDYLDVCRVFTTQDIKDDFESILEHDDDMWSSIERAQERGVPFKDIPRIFTLARSAYLNLTRKPVARTEAYTLSEWKNQKYFMFDSVLASENRALLDSYKNQHKGELKKRIISEIQQFTILENLDYSDVQDQLFMKWHYCDREEMNKEYFSLLGDALKKKDMKPVVDIVWVRDTHTHSTRKINPDGTIQQLFQGRNPHGNGTYYEGDRSLSNNKPDHIQLQIHLVKPTNIDTVDYFAPVFALYIPEECSRELSELVVRTNAVR